MTNLIQVLVVPVNKSPYLKSIKNELEEMQKLVDGYIEVITTRSGQCVVLNEEGKLLELEPNISIGHDYIGGQFFVCNSNEEGDFTSITKEEADNFLYRFVVGKKVDPRNNVRFQWEL